MMISVDVKSIPHGALIKIISSTTPTPTPTQRGKFIVTTYPTYAHVSFNDGPFLPSPATYSNIESGSYNYSVDAKDFVTYSSTIYIPPGTTVSKHVKLTSISTPTPSPIPTSTPIPNRFYDFLDDCVNGSSLTCTWSKLESYLLDLTISNGWWNISETIRRKIVTISIRNTINKRIYYRSTGKPYCSGQEGSWLTATCVPNTIIRILKIGYLPNVGQDEEICTPERGYYKYSVSSLINCFYTPNCFYLPVHTVSCIKTGFSHALASVLINKDQSDINSWIIFQYNEIDIKPGNWQLPLGSKVKFHKPTKICRGCTYGALKGEFNI